MVINMKKVLSLIVTISSLLCIAGCNNFKTVEQSQADFDKIENQLESITKKRNLDLVDGTLKPFENQYCQKEIHISVSKNSKIIILLQNSEYNFSKGIESFSLEYCVDGNDEFDIDFFCELANTLSKKSISVKVCNDFITSLEDKYSAEKYGYTRANNILVYKYYPLNFFEDWVLFYTEDIQKERILSFSGVMKDLT